MRPDGPTARRPCDLGGHCTRLGVRNRGRGGTIYSLEFRRRRAAYPLGPGSSPPGSASSEPWTPSGRPTGAALLTSRYLSRDDGRPRAATAITAIDITLTNTRLSPPGSRPQPRPHRKNPARTGPQPPTRRQRVIALMTTDPRDWSGPNSPNASRSPRATCSPSSVNGPSSASSPAPASPSTPSTRRHPQHPRQLLQTLNYAAWIRMGRPLMGLPQCELRRFPHPWLPGSLSGL